jgi:hypothetical protein
MGDHVFESGSAAGCHSLRLDQKIVREIQCGFHDKPTIQEYGSIASFGSTESRLA